MPRRPARPRVPVPDARDSRTDAQQTTATIYMPGYHFATCALPSGVFSLHVYTRGLTGVAHVSNQP